MLRGALLSLMRRKHGQRVWNPHTSPQGAAPSTGITAAEALQIAYRPMPPAQTVEYEEDFGDSVMIHREFVSKKARDLMDFQLSGLVYSETERRKGRQHFAEMMNRERRASTLGGGGGGDERVPLRVSQEGGEEERRSARYLFNETRMQYCTRFQEYFKKVWSQSSIAAAHGEAFRHIDPQDGSSHCLFSLMEVCAIIYGCETREAQEAYLHMFLGLDTESLEKESPLSDARTERQSDPSTSSAPPVIPSIFDNVEPPVLGDHMHIEQQQQGDIPQGDDARSGSLNPNAVSPVNSSTREAEEKEKEWKRDAGPLYDAYRAHAQGLAPAASYDISTLGSSSHAEERRRWRQLIETLVSEKYDALDEADLGDALLLNEQLHTMKLLDVKVGDTIREMLLHLERETTPSSSLHRDEPINASPYHPEEERV